MGTISRLRPTGIKRRDWKRFLEASRWKNTPESVGWMLRWSCSPARKTCVNGKSGSLSSNRVVPRECLSSLYCGQRFFYFEKIIRDEEV